MALNRDSDKKHFAGGIIVTAPTTFNTQITHNGSEQFNDLTVNSVLDAAGGVTLGGTFEVFSMTAGTIVVSGTGVEETVSLTNVKSDSIILLTPQTDVASDQIINWVVTSKDEGGFFGVLPTAAPTADVTINYLIFGPRT